MTAQDSRPKVVAVIGSPRRRGNTATLVDAALEELERSGCECTRIVLADKRIEFCSGHVFCGERACPHDDDMAGILEQVYAADGLILATPIYYENVSGQMKTFMDRNATRYYGGQHLAPEVVGLIAIAGESDAEDTLAAMRRFLALSNPEELPAEAVGGCADKPGEAAQDAELMAKARALGRSMAESLSRDPG
jgi:multimeric flavodoxin WrbA